jgi:hypothetical protein
MHNKLDSHHTPAKKVYEVMTNNDFDIMPAMQMHVYAKRNRSTCPVEME